MGRARPRIDGVQRAVNMVWRMLQDGCDAPLTVWLSEMWVPLGKLILAWYTIDLMNIFTAWIGVRGRIPRWRSGRHMGGGKKKRRGGGKNPLAFALSFDPGEWIGETLFGGEELSHRTVPPGVTFLWSIYGQIERLNYYFMVLDLGSDFIVNWISGVARMAYCGNREDAVLLATKPWAEQIGIFGWSAVVWDDTQKSRKLTFWNGVGFNQIVGPGICRVTLDYECFTGDPVQGLLAVRIQRYEGITVETVGFQQTHALPGQTGALVVDAPIREDALYLVEILVGGYFRFENLEFYAHAPWRPIQ